MSGDTMRCLPVLTIAWALASGASAQAPAQDAQAGAKAQAERMIAEAKADRFFANATAATLPAARHLLSGLECAFTPGQPGSIHIYESDLVSPGDDVSCTTRLTSKSGAAVVMTMYATRYPQPRTIEQDLSATLASIRTRLPDAKPATGSWGDMAANGLPPHRAIRIQATIDGKPGFTRAAAAVVGPWVIAQRITTDLASAQEADIQGEIVMTAATLAVANFKPAAGAAQDAQVSAQDSADDEARRLLKTVSDPGQFADVTANGIPRLKHKATGITCEFRRDAAANRLTWSAQGVTCASVLEFTAQTFELGYAPALTDARAQEAAAKYIAAEFPGAESMDGFKDLKSDRADVPGHVARRFTAPGRNGGPKVFVRVAWSRVGDWLIFQRAVAPTGAERLSDEASERRLILAIEQACDQLKAGPQALTAAPRK